MPEENNSQSASWIKKMRAVIASAASTTYYGVTTYGQSGFTIASGVGANFFVNLFAAYHSLEYIAKIKNNYTLLMSSLVVAFALSVPYGAITYYEFPENNVCNNIFCKMGASLLSTLGMLVINGLALKQISEDGEKMIHDFFKDSTEKNIEANMKTLLTLLMVQNHDELTDFEELTQLENKTDQALAAANIIFEHSDAASAPFYKHVPTIISYPTSLFIKTVFIIVPFFSAIAVACAGDASLQNDFNASKKMSVIGGNVMMLGEYCLSVTGGLALGSGFCDLMSTLIQYGKVGKQMTKQTLLCLLTAIAVASLSGYTAEKQWEQCHLSLMKSLMIFPYAGISANISCVIFNSIYVKNCMLELWNALFPPKETFQLLLQQWMSDASTADIKEKSVEGISMAKTLTLNPKKFNDSLFSHTRLNDQMNGYKSVMQV